jgi:hypothetical protein
MTLTRCVSPVAPVPAATTVKVEKHGAGAGIRLGILDNSKANADHLLQFLVDMVQQSLPGATGVKRRKPAASRPADAAVIDDLVRETDFVLSAMAD